MVEYQYIYPYQFSFFLGVNLVELCDFMSEAAAGNFLDSLDSWLAEGTAVWNFFLCGFCGPNLIAAKKKMK